jgi:hypothetical protein
MLSDCHPQFGRSRNSHQDSLYCQNHSSEFGRNGVRQYDWTHLLKFTRCVGGSETATTFDPISLSSGILGCSRVLEQRYLSERCCYFPELLGFGNCGIFHNRPILCLYLSHRAGRFHLFLACLPPCFRLTLRYALAVSRLIHHVMYSIALQLALE